MLFLMTEQLYWLSNCKVIEVTKGKKRIKMFIIGIIIMMIVAIFLMVQLFEDDYYLYKHKNNQFKSDTKNLLD